LLFGADFLSKELIIAKLNLGNVNTFGKKFLAKFKRITFYTK